MQQLKKILVAFDGSQQSMNAVRYIGRHIPASDKEITLFNVLPNLPESFLDLGLSEEKADEMLPIAEWRKQQWQMVEEQVDAAKKVLQEGGYALKQIKALIRKKDVGVARDILNESRQGYSAVTMGRTGRSERLGAMMGSVAGKAVASMHHVPLIVVGGSPEPGRILIAFDGSSGSKKCIACVAALLAKKDAEVMLCHVVRPLDIHQTGAHLFKPTYEKDWLDANKRKIIPAITEARDYLTASGFSDKKVTISILSESTSRAGAIVREADIGSFGTIVVGRRGLTIVEEFMLGRVCNKVINLADQKAVWLVN